MKKFLVCESLIQFNMLNENLEKAKQVFAKYDVSTNDPAYIEFFDILKDMPEENVEKYAEWVVKDEADADDIENEVKKIKDNEISLEKSVNSFTSFREFQKYVKTKLKEKKFKEDSEDQNKKEPEIKQPPQDKKPEPEKIVPEEIPNKIINQKPAKPVKPVKPVQTNWIGNRLWVYGVLLRFGKDGDVFVKFGDHRTERYEDARKYAADETSGKLRGIVGDLIDEEDIDIVKDKPHMFVMFCEDVTKYAQKIDSTYVHGERKGFDNYMRRFMPGKRKKYKNPHGGISLELHKMESSLTDQQIREEWLKSIKQLTKEELEPQKVYNARPFHKEMRKKIQESTGDKFLLGAATGSGKELATLETIINIHDSRSDLFNARTVHVSVATIPSTELELFEELSKVSGMNVSSKEYTDFARIKPYCTHSFHKGYMSGLSDRAQRWFSANVKVVKSVSEIKSHNYPHDVPILFGSFPDFGIKASGGDPKARYADLKRRIGILAIGEGHQFLSNISNKLWPSIKKKYNFKFLLVITGTPYDFIFNETADLYFGPEERTLFTRNDLYERKRQGDPAFSKYPDIQYYQLNIGDVVERMKQDERWEGDEHAFTYDKFFEIDKKTGKFKYEDGIVYFFKRLLASDDFTGKRDPLNINNAPGLCEQAKRHIIVALPVGSGGISVHEYIPKLDKLIENSGANGQYNSLAAYEENLGEIKEIIDENKTPTLTLTCRKLLTGTNIPAWGSLIFLRPIGNSVKFFEQATGRIGRAFEDKPNVGVFLGDLNNAMNLHVAVDEKLSLERGENLDYATIVRRTYDNYNFFGSKNGKWEKFDLPDIQQALQQATGEVDYRYNLCLNDPKPPKDFNLEFNWKNPSGSVKVDVTDGAGVKGKKSEIIEKTKQLKIQYDNAEDKEKWYRNMIKTHISKILIICLLKGFKTISQFSDFIKHSIVNADTDALDLIGLGAEIIPQYIDDQKQIDIHYLNRWLDRIQKESSNESSLKGIKERYTIINTQTDLKKLSESLIFDPISLAKKVVPKVKNELISAKKILILEKNGSFTYTILEEIGYENINKLTIITTDALCADIIKYIIGKEITEKEKLLNIKYIKNINEMENMGQFDVVVGNPPYQSPYKTSTFAEQIYPQFVEMGNKIGKTNVQIFPFRGFIQARLKDFKDNIFNFGVKELYIYNEHYVRGTMFQDVTIRSGLCVLVSEKDNFKTVVHSFDRNGKEQIFKDVDLRYNSNILKYREHVNVISKIKTSATFEDYFEGRFASTSSPYFSKDKTADSVKIFVSKNKSKSRFLYIRKKYLKPKQRAVLYKYRAILLSIASNLQSMFKIDQNEIFSNSYSGFVFNSQKERDNFINLCNRKLMIYKFNLEKPFYNLNSKELFKNIPILSLDKTWTDQEIYDHFKLTKEDIKLIESETAITTEDAENIKSEAI